MKPFEAIFDAEIMPLVRARGLNFKGIWRVLVGAVGEYEELWEFASMSEFHEQWTALLNDPQLQEIFTRTGPMVEDEQFALLEPVALTTPVSTGSGSDG